MQLPDLLELHHLRAEARRVEELHAAGHLEHLLADRRVGRLELSVLGLVGVGEDVGHELLKQLDRRKRRRVVLLRDLRVERAQHLLTSLS